MHWYCLLHRYRQEFEWRKIDIDSTLSSPLEIKKALSLRQVDYVAVEKFERNYVRQCCWTSRFVSILWRWWRDRRILLNLTPEMHMQTPVLLARQKFHQLCYFLQSVSVWHAFLRAISCPWGQSGRLKSSSNDSLFNGLCSVIKKEPQGI